MRDSVIRVTTSTGEGDAKKRFGAKKSILVPSSLQEALDRLGEVGVLEAVVEKIEAEETAKLRTKLVSKVSGTSAPASDIEEIEIAD
jgi:hypothetical protein